MKAWIDMRMALGALLLATGPIIAKELPSIAEKTEAMERVEGFYPFYWDADEGKVWLEIPRLEEDFLYVNSLASGLGSNPVGLDRGQLGGERVVRFLRSGPRVLLLQPNLRFRAVTENPLERRAVEESFAQSVLWGGNVAAESDGMLLVDFTSFLIRDAHNVNGTLQHSGQGNYQLDPQRSVPYRPRTKGFPDNSEFEALLTFQTSGRPGSLVSETTPSADAITLRLHHSLIRLPDDGYRPRRHDPRAATISLTYSDYASPLDAPLERRWALRHRLEKRDPSSARSEAVEPIVYYVDPGAPQQIQQALIEGASWWNQAFEAAGYLDAFRVEVLPADADPLDVRYNMIQWVHRSTRGWSYGSSISDPRTGEILKGHVSLGSLRVRQDRMIFEGLRALDPAAGLGGLECLAGMSPGAEFLAELDPDATPVDLALARIRQLSAHEVGHTLGFAHNFAASSYGRESVMDYPSPLASVDSEGNLDLSKAYDVGIGEWDKISARYAYSDFPEDADEQRELEAILQEAIGAGYLFISDADSRPSGAVHPLSSLWDNGADPVSALRDILRVRRIGLDRFGTGNLLDGQPLALLEETLVPLYLHHRYQTEATVKMLAGAYFSYALKGDGQTGVRWVPAQDQRSALSAVLETLDPSQLTLPAALLESLPPLPLGYYDERERFPGFAGRFFDPLAAARVAADIALEGLLQPNRAERLLAFHARDGSNPDLWEVVDAVFSRTWGAPYPADGWQRATARVVRMAAVDHLIRLAGGSSASPGVRAVAASKLRQWEAAFSQPASGESAVDAAHRQAAADQVRVYLSRPGQPLEPGRGPEAPPGSPIGQR